MSHFLCSRRAEFCTFAAAVVDAPTAAQVYNRYKVRQMRDKVKNEFAGSKDSKARDGRGGPQTKAPNSNIPNVEAFTNWIHHFEYP